MSDPAKCHVNAAAGIAISTLSKVVIVFVLLKFAVASIITRIYFIY